MVQKNQKFTSLLFALGRFLKTAQMTQSHLHLKKINLRVFFLIYKVLLPKVIKMHFFFPQFAYDYETKNDKKSGFKMFCV